MPAAENTNSSPLLCELCNGGMDMNLTVIALAYIEIELHKIILTPK